MKFLTLEEVIEIHQIMIQRYGGLEGIRDIGLLISAIEMPKSTMFGEFLHPNYFDKAAAYLYHLVCNHAFVDGNKRTGATAALVFLDMNNIYVEIDESLYEELVVRTAEGKIEKGEISLFFKQS